MPGRTHKTTRLHISRVNFSIFRAYQYITAADTRNADINRGSRKPYFMPGRKRKTTRSHISWVKLSIFRADFFPNNMGTHTKTLLWPCTIWNDIHGIMLSKDASLGLCTFPAVGENQLSKKAFEIRWRRCDIVWCAILRVIRNTRHLACNTEYQTSCL